MAGRHPWRDAKILTRNGKNRISGTTVTVVPEGRELGDNQSRIMSPGQTLLAAFASA
jgi:hypothetical protein